MVKCEFEVISLSFKIEETVCMKDEEFVAKTAHLLNIYVVQGIW